MPVDERDGDAHLFREAEALFAEFVRNANDLGHDPRTVRAALERVADASRPASHDAAAHVAARRTDARFAPEPDDADDDAPTGMHALPASTPAARRAEAPRVAPPAARWDDADTARGVVSDAADDSLDAVPAVLLTRRRSTHPPPPRARLEEALRDVAVRAPSSDEPLYVPPSPRGLTTQRREARAVVPEVARVAPPARPAAERGEDGEMPPRELERWLADMAALRRWGHEAQVRGELDKLRARYPNDLLLARRVAEFHLEAGEDAAAMDVLFALAGQLFARRNVEGMRAALEQVLVLDPGNERAGRLLALLVRRASEPSPR